MAAPEQRSQRVYKTQNVYDASQERLAFIFANFERIYLSFSGGKDSGVMLNLVLQYMRENNITQKIGVMVMDNETNYTHSLDFMHSILEKNLDLLDVYWLCIPLDLPCSVSSYETNWNCWGENDKARWVMPRPDKPYVVTFDNHPFPFYRENMLDKEFYDEFLINALSVMSPYGPEEKQALLEAADLKMRAEVLIALAEIELASNGGTGSTLQ